ncbi:5'-AMP-activated protein kinase beta subunit, interation domain-containing protein [Mrakia frigida]|uniref:protein kinase subunit beta n=1 Tax=Mrakia frigida TaxID=29902 RepID=UPI003FCC18D5
MGNGQSSPASPHGHQGPSPQKHSQPSHRDNTRPVSPGLANRRRKSLELPDLASLTFTNASTPASSKQPSPAVNGLASPPPPTTPGGGGGKFASLTRPGALGGRKRPSPLAPAMSTAPLSPITTRPSNSTTSGGSYNPYFPSSAEPIPSSALPVAIPASHHQAPLLSSGLPDYSRMTYNDRDHQSHMPKSPPQPQPQPKPTTTTTPSPSATKKARIVDPKAQPPPSTPPPPPPRAHHHKAHQPSVGGADEDNYIRSSLPLGGEDVAGGSSTPAEPGLGEAGSSLDPAAGVNEIGKKDLDEEMRVVEAEAGVPTIITWTGGGREVFVCGTFAKNWGERVKMSKSTQDFTLVLNLPPGPHRLKFIVDESWRCSDDLATATDADGSLVNYIEVEKPAKDGDVKTDWEGDWDNQMGGVEPEDQSLWTTEIPEALINAQATEEAHQNYLASLAPANRQPGSAALQNPPGLPNPPSLPRHLEKVILNNPPKDGGSVGVSSSGSRSAREEGTKAISGNAACWTATPDDNSILPIPNHVVLNHLTASAIRNGTLAVGTTTRYKRKYISTLLYKPVEI